MIIGNYNNYNPYLSYVDNTYNDKNALLDLANSRVNGVNQKQSSNATTATKSSEQCQTCKNRKYIDSSNEGNVSFKSATHVSPEASFAAVASHEGEHVANAQAKGNEEGAELVSANVRIKMAVCPECGKAYAAGGVTSTTIKYSTTPYDGVRKLLEGDALRGANVDQQV